MKNIIKFITVSIVFAFVACSDSTDDNIAGSIPNTPLAGIVFNNSFVASGGKAFMSGDKLSINITNIEAGCSSSIFDYDLYVSTVVKNEVGTFGTNVTFHKEGEIPMNVLQSTVVVKSITATQIVVQIKSSTSDSKVKGVFTVPFCE